MRKPNGGRGLLDRAIRASVSLYDKWGIRYVLAPVLIAAIPGLVLTYYGNQDFANWINTKVPNVSNFLKDNVFLVVLLVSAYPTVLVEASRALRKRAESRNVDSDALLALLAALDSIVGLKQSRFSQAAAAETLTKETAFCHITNPQIQIAEIVRSICDFFNATRPDGKRRNLIRVSLARVEDGKVVQIPIWFPNDEPVRSSVEALNNPGSCIMSAIKAGKIQVIGSIQKELKRKEEKRRFFDTGAAEDNIGSIICYPVFVGNRKSQLPFVISIHVDEENYFNPDHSDLYEHSLQRFALRMGLEYSLIALKERFCEPAK